jgi:hypothetical protein
MMYGLSDLSLVLLSQSETVPSTTVGYVPEKLGQGVLLPVGR